MAKRFKSLISSWSNLDYQIGISNAAPDWDLLHGSNGKLLRMMRGNVPSPNPLRYLTPTQPSADWLFGINVSYGGQFPSPIFCNYPPYCEYNLPEPLRELKTAFKKRNDPENQGFFRNGATLIPIIVSAHDERFIGAGDIFSTKPKDVVAAFQQNMKGMNGMKAYSIVVPPGDGKCWFKYNNVLDMGVGGNMGKTLSQFAESTGGKTISICQDDYAKPLANLSQDVRQKITSIELKHVPYKDSLKITFTPDVRDITWTTQGTTVTFSRDLPPATNLAIEYLYNP